MISRPPFAVVLLGAILGLLPCQLMASDGESEEHAKEGHDHSDPSPAHGDDPRDRALDTLRPLFQEQLGLREGLEQLHDDGDWMSKAALFPGADAEVSPLVGSVPLMLETQFNREATDHIQSYADGIGTQRPTSPMGTADALAPLPRGAVVTLKAWWPVSGTGATPLPVWTHQDRARPEGSNGFLSWSRLFRILPEGAVGQGGTTAFAGRYRQVLRDLPVSAFKTHQLSDSQARDWMRQPAARKLARMVLGRELTGGDSIALVAMHMLAGNDADGIWGTIWWGDERSGGTPLGPDDTMMTYRFDATSDAVLPRESDGSANRCFNPWLEGGLLNTGEGAGTDSNCMSCHSRAATSTGDFLRVTRGRHITQDNAQGTAMLWSVAIAQQRKSD